LDCRAGFSAFGRGGAGAKDGDGTLSVAPATVPRPSRKRLEFIPQRQPRSFTPVPI
jgi:hypothetical protein